MDSRLWWIHTATTDGWTLYGWHRQRGQEGIDALGLLSKRDGSVHDFWKPYCLFTGCHALYNAHWLRDLTGIHEITDDGWVVPWSRLLVDMDRAAVVARDAGQARVSRALDASDHTLYDVLVRQGRRHPDLAPA